MSDSDSDTKVLCIQESSDVSEREFIRTLLALYKDNPVLWNASHSNYKNKYKRREALKNICDALKILRPHYTIEDMKKKMNILRTNFNKERNKIQLKKSISPDKEREPILWYYNDMAFLIDQEMPVKRVSEELTLDKEATKPEALQNLKRKAINIVTESKCAKRSESEEDIMVKCWTMKLKKLSPDQKLFAEKIINDTLFEAEMGTLTRHGAIFNHGPVPWTRCSTPVTESHSPESPLSPKVKPC